MNKNKGITLIALVITIIVLLILAGVAIAMLSGENGILRKAAEAKTKTEQAQKKEETTLIDYEIDSHFILKHSKYKCRYGMITGITIGKDTVGELNDALPNGYAIVGDGITDTTNLKTGMEIQKDGVTVAWTVILGDVDGNGVITSSDATSVSDEINARKKLTGCYRVAADVDKDDEITFLDHESIMKGSVGIDRSNQSQYASDPEKILSYDNTELENKYMKILSEKIKSSPYEIELLNISGVQIYRLKGVDSTTKVGDILDAFEDSNVIVLDQSSNTCDRDTVVIDGYTIKYKYKDGRNIDICYILNNI